MKSTLASLQKGALYRRLEQLAEDAAPRVSIPSHAPKHARKLAESRPWDGEISNEHLVKPVPKRLKPHHGNRVDLARERVLDYQLEKLDLGGSGKTKAAAGQEKKQPADDGWAERYKERLLGPEIFLSHSVSAMDSSISSLADRKIAEARSLGLFKNLKGRGQPLAGGYDQTEKTHLDRTEYQMNSILQRQNALPGWIDKQRTLAQEVDNWRHELDVKCFSSKASVAEWFLANRDSLEQRIRLLNDQIRGYNLQAPLPSQKMYLTFLNERDRCIQRLAQGAPVASKRTPDVYSTKPQNAAAGQRRVHGKSLGQLLKGLFR